MKKIITSYFVLIASAICMFAQFPQPQPRELSVEEKAILELSHDKWEWMADKNVEELRKLFHENAVFVHMGGFWGTQQELMTIERGFIHYKHAELLQEEVRTAGNTMIVNSTMRMTAVVGGNEVVNPFYVTEIYLKEGGEYKMTALVFTSRMETQAPPQGGPQQRPQGPQGPQQPQRPSFPANESAYSPVNPKDVPTIKLNNGLKMPQFGLGTFRQSNSDAKTSVLTALKNGYRHFDTAHAYNNEQGVGEAIRESGVPREEIWVTSKLWANDYSDGNTLKSIDEMLERMGLEYIDLLYIHQPFGNYVEAWKDMEKAVDQGKVRSIAISNFDNNLEAFNEIMSIARIKPVAMQIECHPYAQRKDMQELLAKHNMVLECWFPLGSGDTGLLTDPVITEIAKKHGKTNAQIIIRWHIQEGFSVIPGSRNLIAENINIFDFKLDKSDMEKMRSLNKEKKFFSMPAGMAEQYINRRVNEINTEVGR